MKKTAKAPANIAFVKYWGLKDQKLRIPTNGSVSMNLSSLQTTVTVEPDSSLKKDTVVINGQVKEKQGQRVSQHLDLVRQTVKTDVFARVETKSEFPSSAGLASSASSFAALTLAAAAAYDLSLSERELSIISRQGSGSSCRSIPPGFVEWIGGDTSDSSYATTLFPPDYWGIVDVVAVVSTSEKKVSSTMGQMCVFTSPFIKARLQHIDDKLRNVKKCIAEKNFALFGELCEREALELQAITLTSNPPIIYFAPETIALILYIQKLREDGLEVYFTLDAGPNVHILVEKKNEDELLKQLKKESYIEQLIVNYPTTGAELVEEHLF